VSEFKLIIGNKAYSSWSLRGWLALKAAGIDFELEVIPLFEDGHAETMKAKTPAGKVPVLQHGDVTVWESLAIAEYVNELQPDAKLWPENRAARAYARAISSEMATGFPAVRSEFPMNVRRMIPGIKPSPQAQAEIERIQSIWTHCRTNYGLGGPFLFGTFSIADVMYAPMALHFETYGIRGDVVSETYKTVITGLKWIKNWKEAARAEEWVIEEEEL